MAESNSNGQQLKELLRGLDKWVEPHILDRGLDYYREDRVLEWSLSGDWLQATVFGYGGDYEVRVHMLDFGQSHCDCPYDDYCKHMAAAVYAAAHEDTEQPINPVVGAEVLPDEIIRALSALNKEQLLSVLKLALQDKPEWASYLQIWLERRETSESLTRDVAPMDVNEAIVYFNDHVAEIVAQAEDMFEIDQWEPAVDRGYDKWGEPDYGDDRWDCQEGVTHIQHWCDELERIATGNGVLPAFIGLAITLVAVSGWTSRFPEQAEIELTDAGTSCEVALERTAEKLRSQMDEQPELILSLIQFTDWIAAKCSDMLRLTQWTAVLSECVLDGDQLRRLKEQIVRRNPDFLDSTELHASKDEAESRSRPYNESGRYMVDWWCTLCLRHGDAQEAEAAIGESRSVRSSTVRNLASYFAANQRYDKAVQYGELSLELSHHPVAEDYEWLSGIYASSGMTAQSVQAREKALYAGPTWERFDVCLQDLEMNVRREKTSVWARHIARMGRVGLACRMLWEVGETEYAWQVFAQSQLSVLAADHYLRSFLLDFENYDVTRCIAVYQGFIDEYIGHKSRNGYRNAAQWMRTLREAWQKADQSQQWLHYIDNLMIKYHRFRALKEEIQMAGLM